MSRKRTQAEKSWQEEEDGDAPPKRSRRANQAQDKVFHNFFRSGCFCACKILSKCELL